MAAKAKDYLPRSIDELATDVITVIASAAATVLIFIAVTGMFHDSGDGMSRTVDVGNAPVAGGPDGDAAQVSQGALPAPEVGDGPLSVPVTPR